MTRNGTNRSTVESVAMKHIWCRLVLLVAVSAMDPAGVGSGDQRAGSTPTPQHSSPILAAIRDGAHHQPQPSPQSHHWQQPRQEGLVYVDLALPKRIVRGEGARALLANCTITEMCRITPACAGRAGSLGAAARVEASRAGRVLVTPAPLVRPALFANWAEVDAFCGLPHGYRENLEVASPEAREVLRDEWSWEHKWNELLHLPTPQACKASIVAGARAARAPTAATAATAAATGAAAVVAVAAATAPGAFGLPAGPIDVAVPLVELRGVFLGGQFMPFTLGGRAFVPLSTSEDRGGIQQGTTPTVDPLAGPAAALVLNGSHGVTDGGSGGGGVAGGGCCFPRAAYVEGNAHPKDRPDGYVRSEGTAAWVARTTSWMARAQLARAPVLDMGPGPVLLAHGGGWGDFQVRNGCE